MMHTGTCCLSDNAPGPGPLAAFGSTHTHLENHLQLIQLPSSVAESYECWPDTLVVWLFTSPILLMNTVLCLLEPCVTVNLETHSSGEECPQILSECQPRARYRGEHWGMLQNSACGASLHGGTTEESFPQHGGTVSPCLGWCFPASVLETCCHENWQPRETRGIMFWSEASP